MDDFINNQNLFLIDLQAGKSSINALTSSVTGKGQDGKWKTICSQGKRYKDKKKT
jgi:hypothetical protein